jgi:hypothetical protein
MEVAAVRCGLEDTWKLYDEAAQWLSKHGMHDVKLIRRTIRRRNAEAMFGELYHAGVAGAEILSEKLKNYGFDPDLVWRETKNFAPQAKDSDWRKARERELAAMLAFARLQGIADRPVQR